MSVRQGDGSRTRSQGSTTPCADPLTPPPTLTPSERFELPTPSFVARCSRSAELRRQVPVLRDALSHLRREVKVGQEERRLHGQVATREIGDSETSGIRTRILPVDNRML